MIYNIYLQFGIYDEVVPVERYNITHREPLNTNDTMSPEAASAIAVLLTVESMNAPETVIDANAVD